MVHLTRVAQDSDMASVLAEVEQFSQYATRQVLRHRLGVMLRRTYGSLTESVCDSQLVLGLLATLLSKIERDAELCVGAVDCGESIAHAGDPASTTYCSASCWRSLSSNGGKWSRLARGCEGQRIGVSRIRTRKPRLALDTSGFPRVVHTHVQAEPEPTSRFLRWEITETLEHQPASTFVLETRREVRVRAKTDPSDTRPEIAVGPGPTPVFERCMLGASMMAHLVISRVDLGCPTTRKLREYETHGLKLCESTVRDAYARVDTYLAPLHRLFRDDLVSSHIVSTDDTQLVTLDPDAVGNKIRARMWCCIGDEDRVVYFDATPN